MTQEYFLTRLPTREPTHPGEVILEDILPALRLSIKEIAEHLHISRQTLHRILGKKSSITPEMALRLAKFCGNTAPFWLRMQQNWDLWHTEKKVREKLNLIKNHKIFLTVSPMGVTKTPRAKVRRALESIC